MGRAVERGKTTFAVARDRIVNPIWTANGNREPACIVHHDVSESIVDREGIRICPEFLMHEPNKRVEVVFADSPFARSGCGARRSRIRILVAFPDFQRVIGLAWSPARAIDRSEYGIRCRWSPEPIPQSESQPIDSASQLVVPKISGSLVDAKLIKTCVRVKVAVPPSAR